MDSTAAEKFLSVDEVNQLIPQLEHHFKKLLADKQAMAKASTRLKKLGVEPQLLQAAPQDPRPLINELQREVFEHYGAFKQHILAIESLGGKIKDLELGRVEFVSRDSEKLYLLTWQLGVTREVVREELPVTVLNPQVAAHAKAALG